MFYYLPNSHTSACVPASDNSIAGFLSRWSNADSTRTAFATSSAIATPRQCSWIGWRKRPWITRLSALTLTPSQQKTSWEKWVQSLPEFPAKGIRSPGSGESQTIRETSGRKPESSCATAAPASLRWRTSEASLFPTEATDSKLESAGLSTTWPKTGGWASGELFKLEKLEPITSESGHGFWPTARSSMAGNGSDSGSAQRLAQGANPGLKDAAKQWPTVDASGINSGESLESFEVRRQRNIAKCYNGNGMGTPLAIAIQKFPEAELWTTAQAHDVTQRGSGQKPCAKAGNACLARDATTFPPPADWNTPPATLGTAGCSSRSGDRIGEKLLTGQAKDFPPGPAEQWPTSAATDGTKAPKFHRGGNLSLVESSKRFPSSPQPATITPNGCAYSALIQLLCRLFGVKTEAEFRAIPKSLNPRFAAWLMGWEPDWAFVRTNCAASETASSGCRPPLRTTSSPSGCSEVSGD